MQLRRIEKGGGAGLGGWRGGYVRIIEVKKNLGGCYCENAKKSRGGGLKLL